MKLFIHIAILLSAVLAFAGPEDHKQAQVCYHLVEGQLPRRAAHVPLEVCVEEVSVDLTKNAVVVYSYFHTDLFQNLKTDSLVRQTEDSYRFESSSTLFSDEAYVCGGGETVTLKIKGNSDFLGKVQKDQLQITVERETTRDTCHTYPELMIYNYNL